MQRLMRIFLWRPPQPAVARWLEAAAIAGFAVALRYETGAMRGANPGLIFFPALLIATILLGWQEALFVLLISVAAGWCFFLPTALSLMPAIWLVVGSLMIGIIAAFRATAQELAAANERQRILFQVARQRVARAPNELDTPEPVRAALSPARAEAVRILEDAARRIAGAAEVNSRAHNAALLQRELDSILRDAVASVVDRNAVTLSFELDALDLTFDLMSTVTMLVMEIASDSQQQVFQPGKGSKFSVALKALPDNRAALTVRDDGQTAGGSLGAVPANRRRALEVVESLVHHMRGSLNTSFAAGAEFAIEFPLSR